MKINRRQKGEMSYTHDLFKLKVATSLHNVSYRKFKPQLEKMDHVHFFHSHDRNGNTQKYCSMNAGHFHEITTSVDKDGNLKATCGPALRWEDSKSKSGKLKKELKTIGWYDEDKDQDILDDHTHEVTYSHSEEISDNKMRAQVQEDADRLQKLRALPKKPAPQVEA